MQPQLKQESAQVDAAVEILEDAVSEETVQKEKAQEEIESVFVTGQQPVIAPMDEANQRLIANQYPSDWQNPVPSGVYNLIVIGGGSAGLVAATGAAGLGAKVALIERHLLGGDCLNVGCVPSKSVIRSARIFGDLAKAKELGVNIPDGVEVDFGRVMQRMRTIRADISEHESAQHFRNMGVDLYLGDGAFQRP